jgi:large subunit ribosomal protein L35
MSKQKLKSHSGTRDRFKVSKNGVVRRKHTGVNHFQQKKSGNRKRQLAGLETLIGAQSKSVKLNMGV